ncbi:MAG: ACT domain-containing protein [Patescibacteria group bacterium]|nr:ACT domain-containing protein [Patescibacteria group bacterium]
MARQQNQSELKNYFKEGKIYIHHETYAVLKTKRPLPNAFAVIQDQKETTVVIEQEKIPEYGVISVENGWKIITFDLVFPFELVGFLAKVTTSLALAKISVFVLSSYSTDHILVKDKDLIQAIRVLKSLGFKKVKK